VSDRVRTAVRVEGVVQGVGFRPFVYSLATSLSPGGLVGNDVDGVFAEVEGSTEAVGTFLARLEREAPPLARIERVTTRSLGVTGSAVFVIAASEAGGQRRTLVSADSSTCDNVPGLTVRSARSPGARGHGPAPAGGAAISPSRRWAPRAISPYRRCGVDLGRAMTA
jgi:hydrogenase maturation protein HypF